MCGINGIFSFQAAAENVSIDELRCTRDYMFARGPDGKGEWISDDNRIALGHRRLAIIELSELGAQPMSINDGRFVITFNGEIYNHNELRKELEKLGISFRGHSDTEVLLRLYKHYGLTMLHKLRGMFAFAIWDETEKKLVIARDPYGIKPLYYHHEKGTLRFASEVKALLSGNGFTHNIAPAGVIGFFLWGSVPEPLTLYKKINILPAGHVLEIQYDQPLRFNQYWNMAQILEKSFEEAGKIGTNTAIEIAKDAIRDSVKAHMVADVPVGTFLSAGLDSATITGLANQFSPHPVKAVTLGFDEFKGRTLDETIHASLIARELGVEHSIISLSMDDVENELISFFSSMDQPTVDGINTWLVSKAVARSGLKVVLSGLGGDELLGGYRTFQVIPEIHSKVSQSKNNVLKSQAYFNIHKYFSKYIQSLDPNKSAYHQMGQTMSGSYQLVRGLFMPWQLKELLDEDFLKSGLLDYSDTFSQQKNDKGNSPHYFKELIHFESSCYMRNQLLRDTDWIGMAHSLEIRVPLVDHKLTKSIAGFSARKMLGHGKTILPMSLNKTLPQQILDRPKTGFTVPVWRWLNNVEMLSNWKNNSALRRNNVDVMKRWAYCTLSLAEGIKDYLK